MTIQLLILSLILIVPTNDPSSSPPRQSHQVPVTVEQQLGSPIKLALLEADTPVLDVPSKDREVPTQMRITFVSRNLSNKQVTAYAYLIKVWRHGIPENSEQIAFDLSQSAKQFPPGGELTETITAPNSSDVESISVSVDWIEFQDGATWGSDVMKASIRIAGTRAGTHAERTRLLHLFEQKGREELESDLNNPQVVIESRKNGEDRLTDQGRQYWFDRGVQGFRAKIKHIHSSEGIDSVIAELRNEANRQ